VDSIWASNELALNLSFIAKSILIASSCFNATGQECHFMPTSRRSKPRVSQKQKSGRQAGRARTLATPTQIARGSKGGEAGSSFDLLTLLVRHGLDGLSWKMLSGSSAPKMEVRLSQSSTSLKKSGIWAGGSRAIRSMLASPTIESASSLSDLIDPTPPYSSLLTAANATGILRREARAGRRLDPIFEQTLLETVRFWSSVAEALAIPKQRAFAPRFVPRLADIKAAIATDRLSVARNLTWDECEKLMGFPEGWTAVEGGSLAMPSPRQSRNGSAGKSSASKPRGREARHRRNVAD
jgi:hypothetical protein